MRGRGCEAWALGVGVGRWCWAWAWGVGVGRGRGALELGVGRGRWALVLGVGVGVRVVSISFGTTLDRKLFPHNCAQDRTGNELTPLKGAPQRGPGVYNNDEISSSIYQISNPVWHPSSITGCYSAFWVFCCV